MFPIALFDGLPGGLTDPIAQIVVVEKELCVFDSIVYVARTEKEARHAVRGQIRNASRMRRDDGTAAGHRFQYDVAHRLRLGGVNERIGGCIRGRQLLALEITDETGVGPLETAFEISAGGTIADDGERGVGNLSNDLRE